MLAAVKALSDQRTPCPEATSINLKVYPRASADVRHERDIDTQSSFVCPFKEKQHQPQLDPRTGMFLGYARSVELSKRP